MTRARQSLVKIPDMTPQSIYIWQRTRSPHILPIAKALSKMGCDVTFVFSERFDPVRTKLGWEDVSTKDIREMYCESKEEIKAVVLNAPSKSVHLSQGLRSNGLVSVAQTQINRRALRHFYMMETLDTKGISGSLRKMYYRPILAVLRKFSNCSVLAIGHQTGDILHSLGYPRSKIFPFTYFLEDENTASESSATNEEVHLVFAGQLIKRKRVDMLLNAARRLNAPVKISILGVGPEGDKLRDMASRLPGTVSVSFLGRRSIPEVRALMKNADCLVLPSEYDGWGAVVSEALLVGVPAICSDRCGSAEAVLASGVGGIFKAEDENSLVAELKELYEGPRLTTADRLRIWRWAKSLGSRCGAQYLMSIITSSIDCRPPAPWAIKSGKYRDNSDL
jgi:glycosyltransferase involved in cell wall biosynthesis